MNAFLVAMDQSWFAWLALGLCAFLVVYLGIFRRKTKVQLARLEANERRLLTILDNAGALVSIKDANFRYRYANKVTADLFGMSPAALVGRDDFDLFDKATANVLRANDTRVLRGKKRLKIEQVFAPPAQAQLQTYQAVKVPLFDAAGELTSICTYATNITELRRAGEAERLAACIFELHEGMFITDANRIILRVNQALLRMTEYTEAELVGQPLSDLHTKHHDTALADQVWDQIAKTGYWAGEMSLKKKTGTAYPAWINLSAVKAKNGAVSHYVGSQTDITERRAAEQEIHALAFYDSLTGLANRRLMANRLQRSVTYSKRHALCGGLMVVDLDNFKSLNDTLGHDVGDELLRQAAVRLEQCVRRTDMVARLGGDEFVLLIKGLDCGEERIAAQMEAVARKVLLAIDKPFTLGDWQHHISCSIGIAMYPDGNANAEDLLKRGDVAMYEAKAKGRNTFCFFDPSTQQALAKRTRIEFELRRAVDDAQLVLHYQAQVTTGGQLIGAEVLLRWQHPVFGLKGPDSFISIAETSGLIVSMGNWVLHQSLVQLVRWSAWPQTEHLTVSVNISVRQFRQSTFADELLEQFRTTGANPRRLKLELTESLLLEHSDVAIAHMGRLKKIGVRFSLDDFGTGYSSLSYLKQLPLDQLKIDRGFVNEALVDAHDAAIVRTIITLAHSLNLDVIAEGVETEAQRAMLESLGCTSWQGYFFGKPAPVDEMLATFLIEI